jgi:hypothetical protein
LQLLTPRRHQHDTIHRLHPCAPTTPRIYVRSSTSRTRFDVYCAVLRRAVLGTQFFLRAHVFRAFARLGTHCRDGQRREREQPREDLHLDRAMGSRAQEASAWGRPTSHFGVLVKANLNPCMSTSAIRCRSATFRRGAVVHQNRTPAVQYCTYIEYTPIQKVNNPYLSSTRCDTIRIVIGYTSQMGCEAVKFEGW